MEGVKVRWNPRTGEKPRPKQLKAQVLAGRPWGDFSEYEQMLMAFDRPCSRDCVSRDPRNSRRFVR